MCPGSSSHLFTLTGDLYNLQPRQRRPRTPSSSVRRYEPTSQRLETCRWNTAKRTQAQRAPTSDRNECQVTLTHRLGQIWSLGVKTEKAPILDHACSTATRIFTEYTLSTILVIVANMCVPTCLPQDWNRSCGVVAAKNVHVLLGLDASGGPADVPSLRKRSDIEAKKSPSGQIQPALSEKQGIIDTMKHERVQREPG